jgi:hypothetical protein
VLGLETAGVDREVQRWIRAAFPAIARPEG